MTSRSSQHAALSTTLRRLRDEAGLSSTEAARRAGLSQPKVSRLENGKFSPNIDDVRALARVYRAPKETRHELEQAARDLAEHTTYSRVILQRGAWRLQERIGRIEVSAAQLRTFHPMVVPGLLQTRDYARLIFAAGGDLTGEALEATIAARMVRQELLDSGREFVQIVTEGALRWQAGNPSIMIDQLDRLADEATAREHLHLGVVPWTTPAHVFPMHGFDLYDERAVIVGTETATAMITDARDVAAYAKLFTEIEALASFGDDAANVLSRIASNYRSLT